MPQAARRRAAGTGWRPGPRAAPAWERLPLLVLGFIALFAGIGAGLARLGWAMPEVAAGAAAWHGPLMICGFFGVVIGLERAVAIGRWWAYAGPLLAGLGTAAALHGQHEATPWLMLAASAVLLAASLARAVAPARRLHAHHRAGRGLLDHRHGAVGGRLGGPRGGRLVDRLPGADDRRRAAGVVALHAAVAPRHAAVRRHRRCRAGWRCWPGRSPGDRALLAWRCWRWRPGCCATISPGAPCASRGSRASSRCACCRDISGSRSAAR